MQGFVKWFNEQKGYGFIVDKDDFSYFVHYKNIAGEGYRILRESEEVEFEVEETPKGKQAIKVKVIN